MGLGSARHGHPYGKIGRAGQEQSGNQVAKIARPVGEGSDEVRGMALSTVGTPRAVSCGHMRAQSHSAGLFLVLLPTLSCADPRPLCAIDSGSSIPDEEPTAHTTIVRPSSPQRQFDLLFVIDNSPSMAAKKGLVLQSLLKMMRGLEKLEGGLPDLHIGVISTDVGAGEGQAGGDCSSPMGDQGLLWGNDPTPGALASVAGSPGHGCGLAQGVRWIGDRICPSGNVRHRNYQGELADVLGCIVWAQGNHGCGYSHALLSLRLAFAPLLPPYDASHANRGFLRPRASLVIVIISDKDDCSGNIGRDYNERMFSARNPDDSPTLRCAARGHVCGGRAIPHYDPSTGYDGAQGPLVFDFDSCAARPSEVLNDYRRLPLISVEEAIASLRQVKHPDSPIYVAGVIGWPEPGASTQSEYRIDRAPDTGKWALSPICRAPSIEGDGGNVYPAYRLKQFIDAFPRIGGERLSPSMCGVDPWELALMPLGSAMPMTPFPGCVADPLIDRDPNIPDTQPDCQVSLTIPGDDEGDCGGEPEHQVAIPECLDPLTNSPVDPTNPLPQLETIPEDRRPCWYFMRDNAPDTGCFEVFDHQKLAVLFKPWQSLPPGGSWTATCQTSP